MLINVGCEIEFSYPNPTALTMMLYLHPSVPLPGMTLIDVELVIRESTGG